MYGDFHPCASVSLFSGGFSERLRSLVDVFGVLVQTTLKPQKHAATV